MIDFVPVDTLDTNLLCNLMTPMQGCVRVSLGPPDPSLIASITEKNFEFAPVWGIQGVVPVQHLQNLMESGSPLLPDDPQIRKNLLDESTDLERLLVTIARENPVLVINDREVIGLLTLSDLNKHALRSILYSRFATFEMDLAALILQFCEDDHWEWIEKLKEDSQVRILGHWEQSKRKNVEASPIVACTLTDLLRVVASIERIRDVFGLTSQKLAESECGSLPSLRNCVMHPVRPLVTKSEDVKMILSSLRKMQRLEGALKEAMNPPL